MRFRLPRILFSKLSFTQTFPVSHGVHQRISMLTRSSTARKQLQRTPLSYSGRKYQRGFVKCLTQLTGDSPYFLPSTGSFWVIFSIFLTISGHKYYVIPIFRKNYREINFPKGLWLVKARSRTWVRIQVCVQSLHTSP